jgi:hypothetical protein
MEEIYNFFVEKVNSQNGIPTFFDNTVFMILRNGDRDKEKVLSWIINSKKNRFTKFEDRIRGVNSLTNFFGGLLGGATQGTHTVFKWKGLDMFKSSFDLSIYAMLIDEIKPEIIVEYGSGNGSSAIWLSDICITHGLKTKIISYDINKVNLEYQNVLFKNIDLKDLELDEGEMSGKKIIIEDAHFHVGEVLSKTDIVLTSGDYLIVEDSWRKQDIISNFLKNTKTQYVVDNYYLDFFGINVTSAKNSIFKVI